jgi:hypothetical protein
MARKPIAIIQLDNTVTPEVADQVKVGLARYFGTGATRDTDDGKLDFEGFYHPDVMYRYAEYMHKHRTQSDGKLRASDNWQKGMPRSQYMKSMFRHFMDVWSMHRIEDWNDREMEDALCALLFNVQGYLFEVLMDREVEG